MNIRLGIRLGAGAVVPYYAIAAAEFKKRAVADGAIVESIRCVKNEIKSMGDANSGRVLFDAYNLRVETAGGDTEARTCTINELNELL